MFAVKKFFYYLFGQKSFILVAVLKFWLAIYGNKKSSGIVARWWLYLNQYDFQIEYRRAADHQNVSA